MSKVRALLVVPPLLKYSAGPLLGPALLVAAARAAGHEADVLDLNIRWIRAHLGADISFPAPNIVGDHAKPGALLSLLQRNTFLPLLREYLTEFDKLDGTDPHLTLTCSHAALMDAVERMAASPIGAWIRGELLERPVPDVFGVSVLFSGQVLMGLVASHIARKLWPGVRVIWGGPHVTALQDRIKQDTRYGQAVDAFVFGYAEQTFVELLNAVASQSLMPRACVRAGNAMGRRAKDDPSFAPVFQDLHMYGLPRLTLPAQASRGCSYGRCEFCTYPAIEGSYRLVEPGSVEPVIGLAAEHSADIAFKDSLLLPKALLGLAEQVGGRVRFSGCTKLSAALNETLLRTLARGGCDTLEIGLETIDAEQQQKIEKKQAPRLFLQTLDAAGEAGIGLVVNYITGFPGQDPLQAAAELEWVREQVRCRPGLRAEVEHNDFQLERLSPMAQRMGDWGIVLTGEWPWASVLGWRTARE